MTDTTIQVDLDVDSKLLLFGLGVLVLVVLAALITKNLEIGLALGFGIVALGVLKKLG